MGYENLWYGPQGCPIMAALKGDHLYYCYSESVKTWCTNSFIICHNQRLLAWPHANFAYSKGVWTPQSSTIATPRHRAFHWRPNHLCNANAQAAEKKLPEHYTHQAKPKRSKINHRLTADFKQWQGDSGEFWIHFRIRIKTNNQTK